MGCQGHHTEHCEGHGQSRVPGPWRSPRTGTLLLQLQKHPHPNDKEIWYVGAKGRYVHRLMTGRNREKGCVPYRTESDPEQKSQRTAGLLIPNSQIGLNHFSGGRGRGREEGKARNLALVYLLSRTRKLQSVQEVPPADRWGSVQWQVSSVCHVHGERQVSTD